MSDLQIFSYLVPPGKGKPEEELGQLSHTVIPAPGRLYSMLSDVYLRSDQECTVPIRFRMASDGSQNNETRNVVLDLAAAPSLGTGLTLAERLRSVTTGRSGLGLLFLIQGKTEKGQKLVVSRFPADQGVLAEAAGASLDVHFVERVFMRSAKSYKAAVYHGDSRHEDFWDGLAVDKQMNMGGDQLARYWIGDFLQSDLRTTSKAGTRRLAVGLRSALKVASEVEVKQEILAAVALSRNLEGVVLSVNDFMDRFRLSPASRGAIETEIGPELRTETFGFDIDEFYRHARYSVTELDSGAILSAPADRFEDCFTKEAVATNVTTESDDPTYKFTTIGRIVDQVVRGRMP